MNTAATLCILVALGSVAVDYRSVIKNWFIG